MKYRTLGRTGLRVSEVGLGGGGIGMVWGPTTEHEVIRTIHRALELGINFFDVAPAYGEGTAEELLGRALEGRRGQVVVATKVQVPPERFDEIPRYARDSLHESLRRLRTDCVDLLQLHNSISTVRGAPLPSTMSARDALTAAEALHDLRRAGKTRFVGFTAWRVTKPDLEMLLDSGLFDTLQTEYNLINQTAQAPPPAGTTIMDDAAMLSAASADPLAFRYRHVDQGQTIPKAAARNLGVIGIRPYLTGILTSSLDRPVQPGPMKELVRYGQALRFLELPDRTLAQAALLFCLRNPNISTVVPGAKNTAEIEEAAACSDAAALTDEEIRRIAELYARNYAS